MIYVHKKGENEDNLDDDKKSYETFSILALIFAIASPLLGVIFALVSTTRLDNAPQKYKKVSKTLLKWAKGIMIAYVILILFILAILFRFGGL